MLLLVAAAFALDPIEHAVGVHLSAAGLSRLGSGLAAAMPTALPVTGTSGTTACDAANPTDLLAYTLDDLDVGIHIADVALVPSAGRLDITLTGTIDSSEADLTVTGNCPPLASLAEVCAVQLPVTTLSLHVGMALVLVGDTVDATVDAMTLDLSPIGNPLDGCTLASAVGTLLGQDPEAINHLLLDPVEASLLDAGASMETAIEDGFAGLSTNTALALGDSEVQLALTPSRLELSASGLTIGLRAALEEPAAAPCVTGDFPGPSDSSDWPTLDGTAPDGALAYDAALVMNKALVDQILWAAWRSGTLCADVVELSGNPLDTSLFNAVFDEPWKALFPESEPLSVEVRPAQPLTARFSATGAPFRVVLDGLGLSVVSTLDARLLHVFRAEMAGEMGLDLELVDGALISTLAVDPAEVGFVEPEHELLPLGYSDGLSAVLPTLLSTMVPADLLPTVTLPSWQGLGVAGLWWMPDASGQWMGGYMVLDTEHIEPLELPGCEGGSLGCDGSTSSYDLSTALGCSSTDGGCGGAGCSGGTCNSGATGPVRLPWLLIGAVAWVRRRR